MSEAISKAQYMLKAHIKYFLYTKLNLMIMFIVYLTTDDLDSFLIIYIACAFVAYKFIFSQSKIDNPYKTYLLSYISDFIKNLRR